MNFRHIFNRKIIETISNIMLAKSMRLISQRASTLQLLSNRNIASTSQLLNSADPIQQVFIDKIREYYKLKSASKSGLISGSVESAKLLKDEIEKIGKQYGAIGQKFDEFPSFKFDEPKLDPINQSEK